MSANYSTKGIDHLGLVSGICQEIGLVEFIDNSLPKQSDQKLISNGQLVLAMILNGLGFVGRTLHMYPEYFLERPVERLIGKGITSEMINDDALGRCLDQLFETGVSPLYQGLSELVVQHLELPCEGINLDSTSIHVDGRYDNDGGDINAIKLVKGYSRDHRPELNQVVLNLITENQAGIPVYMQAASGNTVDTKGFKKIVKAHLGSLKAAQACRYFIGDAALYVAETIQSLSEQNQLFISRVPQKITQAKQLLAQKADYQFQAFDNGYSGVWVNSDYAGVEQRWLLVHSEQAEKRGQFILDKKVLNRSKDSQKTFKKLCQRRFSCRKDAEEALSCWEQLQDFARVSQSEILAHEIYAKSGRPKLNAEPLKLEYQIAGQLYCDLERRQTALSQKGLFILATNDCGPELEMAKLLKLYKSQQSVEKGFRFLKSPDFLTSSLYLKKPERIEALLMIMTCCLMVYAALEYKIRRELKAQDVFFPDMKYKPSQNPTARWVFFCFQRIDELSIEGEQRLVLNLQERQQTVINCLGDIYQQIYS